MITPVSKRSQTNTAGVTSKDRSASGPRQDGGAGGEIPDSGGVIPIGGIIMWAGAFADIPVGWNLCDGTNGTTDLTDRFILATATEADVGDVGGAKKHRHNLVATDTPAGTATAVAITAGTPAGTLDSVSAGTPSGTIGDLLTDAHTTTSVQSGAGTVVLTGPSVHDVSQGHGGTGSFTGVALAGHTHTFTGTPLGTHTHLLAGKTALGESEAGDYGDDDVLPPWFKLAFIQRIA